ncbi:MAG TPA: hypothetical protein VK358_03575, partial [Longimicrobium sp.]|nr:hypothetical protein [Longimicrobium sp.]
MAWNIGINFRATAGYVADGPGETYSVADAYPVTRGGATFGWTVLPSSGRDRDSSQDRRLAGINQMLNGTGVAEFRL